MSTFFVRAVTAVLVVGGVAGCGEAAAPAPPVPTLEPANTTISTRWIPNPALDLMSPEGTFVRAFIESYNAVSNSGDHTGTEAVLKDGFPGFGRALNDPAEGEDIGGDNPNAGRWGAGTWYFEVVGVVRDGDLVTAEICDYPSLVAIRPRGLPNYRSSGSADFGSTQTLSFRPDPAIAPADQRPPPPDQRGSGERPDDDVFGTWVGVGYRYLGATNPYCHRLAPGTPTDWPDPYIRPDPPPTLTPDPGWPTGRA